jgi:hypothetical protein
VNISEHDWERLQERVAETRDGVIRLETQMKDLFNGGPGTWNACKTHKDTLDAHGRDITEMSRRIYGAVGVVGFITLAGVVVGIYAALHK